MAPMFAAWKPKWIQPKDEENLADLRLLLRERLTKMGVVQAVDLAPAVDVLLDKSGGQFIYSRWVLSRCLLGGGQCIWSRWG